MTSFSPEVVGAILHHMNDDHTDDSLTIVRAFVDPAADAATMTDVDAEGGTWDVVVDGLTRSHTVPWLGPVVERADIRREVVHLHDAAVAKLGLPAREAH
ncbi:MAG: DUF2470 domain-containing protein [Aeromicrobium sp.]